MEIGPGQRIQTLLERVTAARAGKLDEITAARMAELDAANIPADVDTLVTRLSAARAGYLDELGPTNIPADVDTLVSRLTAARAGYLDNINNANLATIANISTFTATVIARIDATISSRSSHAAADIWAVGTRALTDKANFALASGEYVNIRQSVCAVGDPANSIGKALYELYITRLTATRAGYLDNLSAGAVALASVATAGRLAELDAANIPADVDTLLTRVTAAVALASVATEARLAELGAANIPADIDTLLTRLSAARAGYLDNLIGTQTASTYNHPSGITEQDAVEITPAELGKYEKLALDLNTLIQNTTVRTYVQVDGTNYRLVDSAVFPTDFPTNTKAVLIELTPSSRTMKVTLQSAVAEGAVRAIPYFWVVRSLA